MDLDEKPVRKLRDRLIKYGAPPSWLVRGIDALKDAAQVAPDEKDFDVFEAVIDVLLVEVSSDGTVTQKERELLRGAMRELTGGGLSNARVQTMIDGAAKRLERDGKEKRLAAATELIRTESTASELTFLLVAAAALAGSTSRKPEEQTAEEIAKGLGIAPEDARELLGAVDVE